MSPRSLVLLKSVWRAWRGALLCSTLSAVPWKGSSTAPTLTHGQGTQQWLSPCGGSGRTEEMFSQVAAVTCSCFVGKLVCVAPLYQDNFLAWASCLPQRLTPKGRALLLVWVHQEGRDGPNSTPSQLLIFHHSGWNRFAVVLDTQSDSTSARIYLSKTDLAVGAAVELLNKIKQSGCNGWDYSLESSRCDSDFLSQWVGRRSVVCQGALGQEEH